jgi:hypothetical protein
MIISLQLLTIFWPESTTPLVIDVANLDAKRKRRKHTLEIAEILLLVEAGLLKTEAVYDIDDSLCRVLDSLLIATFSRRVSTDVEVLSSDLDLCAVDFVDNTANLLEGIGVGDDLVTGESVLFAELYVSGAVHEICAYV